MKMKKSLRRALATFGIVVTIICSAMPAYASTTTTGTEVSEEEKVYTVVTDKANLLTDKQVANIETKVQELTNYDAALYIENADRKTCTQRYTNELSEKLYSEIFGDYRNGIMIVFSFYEEAGGYYAVHYGANLQIKESKISNIIQGTYHDFKTDATWVEGSFLQCVDYLKEAELVARDNTNSVEEKEPLSIRTKILMLALMFMTCIAILAIHILVGMKDARDMAENSLRSKEKENIQLQGENLVLKKKVTSLENQVSEYQKWKENAIKVKTDIQTLIDDNIARETAQKFDESYSDVVSLEAIVENFESFDRAMNHYENLTDSAKQYVDLDVKTLSKKRQTTGELYAREATNKIEEVCNRCTGSRHDRYELNDTLSYYNSLPLFVRLMIAESLVDSLKHASNNAENAQRRYQNSHSSYSNSYGGNTFGGGFHGGGTFGGGFHGGH